MKYQPPIDANDLDAPPPAPLPKYKWPECPPSFDRVRGDLIITEAQLQLEKAQIASGEKTMVQIFREYGLTDEGRKKPGITHLVRERQA